MQLLGLLCTTGSLIAASPIANLLINAQVPPVARANGPYTFTFSESTFTSTVGVMTYGLVDAPRWLVLDSKARTLSGTPKGNDIGSAVAKIVATDKDGSMQMPFTLIISDEPGPGLGLELSIQLPAFGAFSSPNSILFPPSAPFSISFSHDTFSGTNQNTVYYATTTDNTPLPSWVQFDRSRLAFSGQTPSLPSPLARVQTFGVRLAASNVLGFSAASTSFNIVVGDRLLAFRSSTMVVNVTAGLRIQDSSIARNLAVDGKAADLADIKVISAPLPSWLHLNPFSLELSGIAPLGFIGQNSSLTVASMAGNSASVIVALQATQAPALALLNPIGTANATIGSEFAYKLGQMINALDAQLAVELGVASAWLEFDAQSKVIKGQIPKDIRPQQIFVNITASLDNQTQSELLTIAIQSSRTAPITSESSHPTAQSTAAVKPPSRFKKRIIPAIVVPSIAFVALCLFLGFVVHNRRRKQTRGRSLQILRETSSGLSKRSISRPSQPHRVDATASNVYHEKLPRRKISSRFSLPPQLPLLPSILSAQRQSKGASSKESRIDHTPNPQSWRLSTSFLNISRPYSKAFSDFRPIPEETPSRKLSSQPKSALFPKVPPNTISPNTFRRRRDRLYPSYSGLVANHKQVKRGLGHGKPGITEDFSSFSMATRASRHGTGPPGFGEVRPSWRDLDRSNNSSEWATASEISSSKEGQRKFRDTIRPVRHSNTFHSGSTSSWVQYDSQVPIPTSARKRQMDNPFLSARSARGRGTTRRTRSRSSSLDPPLRPPSAAQHSFPRTLKVREGACRPLTRGSLSSQDPRFESAIQSEIASMCEHAYADDIDDEDVRPGLPAAAHRQSNAWTDLTHRIKRIEPAFDDNSSIFGGEESTLGSRDETMMDVKLMSRGQRLAHQMGLRPTDPANRSMKGRIERSDTFSTGGRSSKRLESISFV